MSMTQQEWKQAAEYWEMKDADSVKMDRNRLKQAVEEYIQANNTCALATGAGDFVRCTPIEYGYHDGCFWMFSEGGRKFAGLSRNLNVCLAIYDKYDGFGNLHGMQVTGGAELIEPFSERYNAHAAWKKIPLEALKKLDSPMHLIHIAGDVHLHFCLKSGLNHLPENLSICFGAVEEGAASCPEFTEI